MTVPYASFGSKVRPRTFGCVAMGSAVLFILSSRLLVYSAGSGVNRVQVVLSGFSKRLFCCVQAKTVCTYGCMYFLAAVVLVCVDVMLKQIEYRYQNSDVQTENYSFISIYIHACTTLIYVHCVIFIHKTKFMKFDKVFYNLYLTWNYKCSVFTEC